MSTAAGKKRATKAQVTAQRAEALRLRATGLTAAQVDERLGVSASWAEDLIRPVPPNHCRACGGEIEPRKQYHLECRPSHQPPTGKPRGPQPRPLPKRRYGLWEVLGYAGDKKWLCRCRCGVERAVRGHALRAGLSSGCKPCRTEEEKLKGWQG